VLQILDDVVGAESQQGDASSQSSSWGIPGHFPMTVDLLLVHVALTLAMVLACFHG
jgi:hypothetical protein